MSDDEQPCPRDSGAVYMVGLADRCGAFWWCGPLAFEAAKAALREAGERYHTREHTAFYSNREREDCDTDGLTDAETDALWEAHREGACTKCDKCGELFRYGDGSDYTCDKCRLAAIEAREQAMEAAVDDAIDRARDERWERDRG